MLEIVVVPKVGVFAANQANGASHPKHKTPSKPDPADEEVESQAEARSGRDGGLGPTEIGQKGDGEPQRNECDPENATEDHGGNCEESSFQLAGEELHGLRLGLGTAQDKGAPIGRAVWNECFGGRDGAPEGADVPGSAYTHAGGVGFAGL